MSFCKDNLVNKFTKNNHCKKHLIWVQINNSFRRVKCDMQSRHKRTEQEKKKKIFSYIFMVFSSRSVAVPHCKETNEKSFLKIRDFFPKTFLILMIFQESFHNLLKWVKREEHERWWGRYCLTLPNLSLIIEIKLNLNISL